MNKIKGLVAISAFSLLLLGLPAIASAQWNGGYGNGGYGNRGGYGGNIKSVVRSLKDRAERFEDAVDRSGNNNGRYGRNGGWGNNRGYGNYGGDLESLANQFKDATDDLEDAYGNGRNLSNSEDEARRVLDIASAIDQQLGYSRRGGGGNLYGQWSSMRQDLNAIANTYGYNNGNNRNNRRNRNGNWRNNIPFPLPF